MKSTLTPLQPTMQELGTWLRGQTPHWGIRATVLHHTWLPNSSQYQGRQTIIGIRSYHVNARGWSDIGANLYACPSGTVYTARPLNARNSAGDPINYAHALVDDTWIEPDAKALCGNDKGWFNHHAIGLEMIADFGDGSGKPCEDPDGHPSLECALRVLTVVHQVYELPASRLFFHRDVSPKSCPGAKLNRATIRADLKRRLEGTTLPDEVKVVLLPGSTVIPCRPKIEEGICRVDLRILAEKLGYEVIANHLAGQGKVYIREP